MGAPADLVNELVLFKTTLESRLGTVDKVLLFGSRSRGEAGRDSDVDILVVSEAFVGLSHLKRVALVGESWDLPYPVDFLCYTPSEFERRRLEVSIVSVALEEGTEIGAA